MDENSNVEQLVHKPKREKRKKSPAQITVYFSEGNKQVFEVNDVKDWGVMFDNNVLNINDKEGTEHYYVLGNLYKWEVDELNKESA